MFANIEKHSQFVINATTSKQWEFCEKPDWGDKWLRGLNQAAVKSGQAGGEADKWEVSLCPGEGGYFLAIQPQGLYRIIVVWKFAFNKNY